MNSPQDTPHGIAGFGDPPPTIRYLVLSAVIGVAVAWWTRAPSKPAVPNAMERMRERYAMPIPDNDPPPRTSIFPYRNDAQREADEQLMIKSQADAIRARNKQGN